MLKHIWSSLSGGEGVEAEGCRQGSEPQLAFGSQWLGKGGRQVSLCVLFILN